MEEFRDDVSMKFIKNFKGIDKNDFKNITWQEYIETMISTDPLDVQVRMVPPKAYLIGETLMGIDRPTELVEEKEQKNSSHLYHTLHLIY